MRTSPHLFRTDSTSSSSSTTTTSSLETNSSRSPFFYPSTPKRTRNINVDRKVPSASSHIGTQYRTKKSTRKDELKQRDDPGEEHKSSIFEASSNLVNAIVGAGIVGMPYAINQCGLITGVVLIFLCAVVTDKSFRLLIETAKFVNVSTYETLFEAGFGRYGFAFIATNMFLMAYGAMISYLVIIKDTLPILLGVDENDLPMRRTITIISTFVIILPLTSKRDVADLAKMSQLNVLFDCVMVAIVAFFSPISTSVEQSGGWKATISHSLIKPSTLFIGLGVLSLAFGCQHSSFIIAGSLKDPTKKRWGKVTRVSLSFSAVMASICGITGYLGFQERTEGNVLNNFLDLAGGDDMMMIQRMSNVARALLCTTMFFVFPMDAFVARHVCVVGLFHGRRAHEGEDYTVLSRTDRRIVLSLGLYLMALIPSLLLENAGTVLAITGTVAGSCLAYVGPGLAYLAVHGDDFISMVKDYWSLNKRSTCEDRVEDGDDFFLIDDDEDDEEASSTLAQTQNSCDSEKKKRMFTYYMTLMPLWIRIASIGRRKLEAYKQQQALESPHMTRLGVVVGGKGGRVKSILAHKGVPPRSMVRPPSSTTFIPMTSLDESEEEKEDNREEASEHNCIKNESHINDDDENDEESGFFKMPPVRISSLPSLGKLRDAAVAADIKPMAKMSLPLSPTTVVVNYGSVEKQGKREREEEGQKCEGGQGKSNNEDEEEDDNPKALDFTIAIAFVVFGVLAMVIGLWSIFANSDDGEGGGQNKVLVARLFHSGGAARTASAYPMQGQVHQ